MNLRGAGLHATANYFDTAVIFTLSYGVLLLSLNGWGDRLPTTSP
jgi:hypothetical protein